MDGTELTMPKGVYPRRHSIKTVCINGWKIIRSLAVLKGERKRWYHYVRCPSCRRICFKREDHLLKTKVCGRCWNTINRESLRRKFHGSTTT